MTESTQAQVSALRIHSERRRFKHKEPPIRLLAYRDICSAIALDKGEKAAEDFKRELAAKLPSIDAEDLHTAVDALAPSNHVPLVDLSSLPASKPWRVCSSYAWTREEHISVLEARTLVSTLRHAIFSRGLRDCRVVIVSDSMAAILSGSKGRSRKPGMCRALRQLTALLLFANITLVLRWVPSEVNHGDIPSRRGYMAPAAYRQALARRGIQASKRRDFAQCSATDLFPAPPDSSHREEPDSHVPAPASCDKALLEWFAKTLVSGSVLTFSSGN